MLIEQQSSGYNKAPIKTAEKFNRITPGFQKIATEERNKLLLEYPNFTAGIPKFLIHPSVINRQRERLPGALYDSNTHTAHAELHLPYIAKDLPSNVIKEMLQAYHKQLRSFAEAHKADPSFAAINFDGQLILIEFYLGRAINFKAHDSLLFPSSLSDLSDDAVRLFTQAVILPIFLETKQAYTAIEKYVRPLLTHETGHGIFNTLFPYDDLLSDSEMSTISVIAKQVFNSEFKETYPKLRERAIKLIPDADLRKDYILTNNSFVNKIASEINDSNLRERYIKFTKLKALDEDFARAFNMTTTSKEDYISDVDLGINYGIDYYFYLGESDKRIDKIIGDIKDKDAGDFHKIISKYAQEILMQSTIEPQTISA